MPAPCPRCNTELVERFANTSAGYSVPVHACESCGGLFIDGEGLVVICPTLSHLPEHRGEVAIVGERAQGIPACLRCERPPHEYEVVGVKIDFCTHCGAVWLDGGEYEEGILVENASDKRDARNPYRASMTHVVQTGMVDCARCKRSVAIVDTYAADEGMICADCHTDALKKGAETVIAGGPLERLYNEVAGAVIRVVDGLGRRERSEGRPG
jgi:Zn-finger nucleic acid-binding protein